MSKSDRDFSTSCKRQFRFAGHKLTGFGAAALDKATDILALGEGIEHLAQVAAGTAASGSRSFGRELIFVGEIASAGLPLALREVIARSKRDLSRSIFRGPATFGTEPLADILAHQDVDALLLFAADKRLEQLPSGWTTRDLWEEPFYIAVEPDHALAKLSSITMEELRDQVFIFPRGEYLHSYESWEEFERICQLHGFLPRSTSRPFSEMVDMYGWNITTEVCPINQNTPVAHYFFGGDFVCIPVSNERYPHIVAAYREDDIVMREILEEVAAQAKR